MFTAKLFDFQTKHEESLLVKCADHEELVLSAPTDAGKTVLVSKFIDDYLDENPNAVFLWLCPGAGGLDKQSQDSFREVTSGIPDGDVYAFINESDPQGKVFFINWGKIKRSSNVVLREWEYRDLIGKVMFCHTNSIDIFRLIDEEHKLIDGLSLREYNAFLVNNRERLIEVFSGVSADRIAEIEETDIISADRYIFQGNSTINSISAFQAQKSWVRIYLSTTAIISLSRQAALLQRFPSGWCEHCDLVEWCYKNDDVWIIEAKGSSNNIDKYAPRKFEALKDYVSRHLGIKWGFVRAVGTADLYVQHCLVGRCNKSKCLEAD